MHVYQNIDILLNLQNLYTGMRSILVAFNVSIALIEMISISRHAVWSCKFRHGSTCSLISLSSHLDNKYVTIHSMTPYPSYMPVSLLSKLFEFPLIGSFLGCLWQLQKVVRHILRVYISWSPPHPADYFKVPRMTGCALFLIQQHAQLFICT